MKSWASLFYLLSYFFLLTDVSYSYVHSRNEFGVQEKWADNVSNIPLNVVTTNGQGFSHNTVLQAVAASISQWNGASSKTVSINSTNGQIGNDQNDVYFSSDSPYIGPGVAGATVTRFNLETGEIKEADIIINDSEFFSSSTSAGASYIGNVMTHELGHLLGLSHSQTNQASMFFFLSKGQHTISQDDKAGIRSLYANSSFVGISGRIIGGKSSAIGIFGAHVSAISIETGDVAGATLSGPGGYFHIGGLDSNTSYHIYVENPEHISSLPKFYRGVKSNFCDSRSDYRGSFYQSCLTKDEGYPQAVRPTSTNHSVGNITIRCNLDVPIDYLGNKGSVFEWDIVENFGSSEFVGDTYVGFFTNDDLVGSVKDEIEIDLTSLNLGSSAYSGKDLYLELNLSTQTIWSRTPLQMTVTDLALRSENFPLAAELDADGLLLDGDDLPRLDFTARFELDTAVGANNRLTLEITPKTMSQHLIDTSQSSLFEEEYFPYTLSSTENPFIEDLNFYLLTARLVEKSGSSYLEVSRSRDSSVQDNLSCLDAPEAFAVSQVFNVASSQVSRGNIDDDALSVAGCGMISLDEGDGPPPSGFVIVFLMGIIFSFTLKLLNFRD